jgi:small subunit ribosomal protein S15
MLKDQDKNQVVEKFRINEQDTGSAHVQVALLTKRINEINDHLRENKHDYASKRGLIKLVGRRRRFLRYVKNQDESAYKELLQQLKLRR